MAVQLRQTSFSAGYIGRTLRQRADLAAYGFGLADCLNFIPTADGQLMSRQGTQFIGELKNMTGNIAKLFWYDQGTTARWLIEFGAGFFAFWRNDTRLTVSGAAAWNVATNYVEGQYVSFGGLTYRARTANVGFQPDVSPTEWEQTSIYYVTNTYTGISSEFESIRTAQVGDVFWITAEGHPPRTLTRVADTNWVLADVTFSPKSPVFGGSAANVPAVLTSTIVAEDVANGMPYREWSWMVTAVVQDENTGVTSETTPWTITKESNFAADPPVLNPIGTALFGAVSEKFAVYPNKPITIKWPTSATPATEPDYGKIIAWRVYRGRGKLFGLLGETTTREFIDDGSLPDYSVQPPQGRNPFEIRDLSNAVVRTETPRAITFFEQRLVYAGTTERGGWVFLSRTGDFYNFDNPVLAPADAGMEFELASHRREKIHSLLGLDRLFMFTEAGIWVASGGSESLTRATLARGVTKHTDEGADRRLVPVVAQDALLYARRGRMNVNELAFSLERGKHLVQDVSAHARDLFDTRPVTGIAYQHDPWRVVWMVTNMTNQGESLLSLTYDRARGVYAWARHKLGGAGGSTGAAEQIAVIPAISTNTSTQDDVYITVRRTINGVQKRYLEKMSRFDPRIMADSYVTLMDCHKTVTQASSTTITGLSHLEGETVGVMKYDGNTHEYLGTYVVTGGQVTGLSEAVTNAVVGLVYTRLAALLEPQLKDNHANQKMVVALVVDVERSTRFSVGDGVLNETGGTTNAWVSSRGLSGVGAEVVANEAVFTGQVRVVVPGTWASAGQVTIRETSGAPLTILGVTRELEFGST